MAVVSVDELIVTVFMNDSGGVTIQQIGAKHGAGAMVSIARHEVADLIEVLQIFLHLDDKDA